MFPRRRFNLILTSVLIVGGFLFLDAGKDAVVNAEGTPTIADHLVISQVQITGGTGQTTKDFVELYNPTELAVDLSDWKLRKKIKTGTESSVRVFSSGKIIPAHGYFLWANSEEGFGDSLGADTTSTVTLTDNSSLALFDKAGNLVDAVAWGSGHINPFIEGTAFDQKLEANQALVRMPNDSNGNGKDTNNNAEDFLIATSTPRNSSAPAVPPLSNDNPPENPPPSPPSSPPESPPPSQAEEPALVSNCLNNNILVNELLINPEDGGKDAEFIELYNQSNQEVDLSGWVLEDVQGKIKTYVIPNGAKIGPLAFRVFYGSETKITLNNSGDGVKLFDAGKNWCDSSPADSGAAKEGLSFSREESKWFWTAAATPNSQNEVGPEREKVVVYEVIDGDTIKLADGRKVRYIGINAPELGLNNKAAECFSQEALAKNRELVLGKEVTLERDVSETDNYGRLLRYVYLKDIFINDYLAREGFAFSSSYPPDNKYQTQLVEAQEAAQAGQKGLWQTCRSEAVKEADKNSEIVSLAQDTPIQVVLNELLPNPAGSDNEKEFIELKNIGETTVNLEGWRLEMASRRKYVFSASSTISQQGFLVLWRKQSGLTLRNTKEENVKLFNPAGQLIDEVTYNETVGENVSFNRLAATSTFWQWSISPTPGTENIIHPPNYSPLIVFELPDAVEVGEEIIFDASDTVDPEGDALSFLWDFGDGGQSVQEMATHTFQKAGRRKIVLKVNDHQGNEAEQKVYLTVLGEGETDPVVDSKNSTKSKSNQNSSGEEQVRFVGLVTVPPGLFASQTFYLQVLSDDVGLQIYMNKKDFPLLSVGDKVEVAGEMSAIQNGTRLKIKSRSDIKVLTRVGTGFKPVLTVEPEELVVADLSEEYLDDLVKVAGEVLEPKSGQFYLADESGEVLIQLKSRTGLKGRLVKEGDAVEVTGILGQSKGEWRVWPRFVEDIKITGFSGEKVSGSAAADEEKKTAKKYLTVTAGGLTSLLLALFAKSRSASAKGLALGLISRVSFWRRKDKIDRNGTV